MSVLDPYRCGCFLAPRYSENLDFRKSRAPRDQRQMDSTNMGMERERALDNRCAVTAFVRNIRTGQNLIRPLVDSHAGRVLSHWRYCAGTRDIRTTGYAQVCPRHSANDF